MSIVTEMMVIANSSCRWIRMTSIEELFEKMRDFHNKYDFPHSFELNMALKLKDKRFELMQEENNEYNCSDNIIDVLDAIGDQAYVLIGTMITHGVTADLFVKIFDEIHASNMSKDQPEGYHKPIKGKNYFEPNIPKILDGDRHDNDNPCTIYRCPKCKSENIRASGCLSVLPNKNKIHSVETLEYFQCLDCKFSEEWIEADGSPIMSELEAEWLKFLG
ncbi:hypothetical protein LCGC14_0174480 [marine sediment metagenome]|uniref:Uncharacterized protein n=1 Tax=marine sediment metagenome TaxID=412755 RepID=A0A0F9UV05_9ZZZZ